MLRGEREGWLCVEPLLLRGDIDYDLAPVLWTRLDEMPDATAIVRHFDTVVREAGLVRDRARDWVLFRRRLRSGSSRHFRTVDYWLRGLEAGLTDDPVRCGRLAAAITG